MYQIILLWNILAIALIIENRDSIGLIYFWTLIKHQIFVILCLWSCVFRLSFELRWLLCRLVKTFEFIQRLRLSNILAFERQIVSGLVQNLIWVRKWVFLEEVGTTSLLYWTISIFVISMSFFDQAGKITVSVGCRSILDVWEGVGVAHRLVVFFDKFVNIKRSMWIHRFQQIRMKPRKHRIQMFRAFNICFQILLVESDLIFVHWWLKLNFLLESSLAI